MPLNILYDAECQICVRGKVRLENLDKTHRLKFVPLQVAEAEGGFQLDPRQLRRAMHLITEDGRVLAGARAFREIGRAISARSVEGALLKVYTAVTRVPGAIALAEGIYRLIAANRHRWDPVMKRCRDGTCAIHGREAEGSDTPVLVHPPDR